MKNLYLTHVKGHQDRGSNELDIYAQLNVHADEIADGTNENTEYAESSGSLQQEKWALYLEGRKIVKNVDVSIREYIYKPKIQDQWHKKERIHREHFEEVTWETMKKVMKTASIQTKQWIIKRAANECGSNSILFQRSQRADDKCPFCGERETPIHVYQCQNTEVKELWRKLLYGLENELLQQQTDPAIAKQLCYGLLLWQEKQNNIGGQRLLETQSKIGWNGIMEGCLGEEWKMEQELFFKENAIKKSGERWAQLVIRKLWKIAWEIWQHRNKRSHLQDEQYELERVRSQVSDEIIKGFEEICEDKYLFSDSELEKVQGAGCSMAYAKAWLRNIRIRREKAQSRPQESREIELMRGNMYRFLNIT
jgi:hypothetical protein